MTESDCRRRHKRVDRALIAYYSRPDSNEMERAGLILNVSLGGLMIEVEEELQMGDLYTVELSLKERESTIAIPSKVVRTGGGTAGLEFIELSEPEHTKLDAYLKARYLTANPTTNPK